MKPILRLLFFPMLLTYLSCTSIFKMREEPLVANKDWALNLNKLIDKEGQEHEKANDNIKEIANYNRKMIKQSDFENNIMVLDSLKRTLGHVNKKTQFVLVTFFNPGFNFWDCTYFITYQKHKKHLLGYEFCKIWAYDFDNPAEISLKPIDFKYKELKRLLRKTSVEALGGLLFTTTLDNNLQINKMHVAVI